MSSPQNNEPAEYRTHEENDHPDIITLTLTTQGSFLVSNTFHSVYQLKEMI